VSISRRAFLASIPALYAALKNIDLDMEPVKVLLPPVAPPMALGGGDAVAQLFRIDFPDGATMTFHGYVTQAQTHAAIDDICTAELSIQPTGEVSYTPPTELVVEELEAFDPEVGGEAISARGVEVTFNGESLGDIREIQMPTMRRQPIDVTTAMDTHQRFELGPLRVEPMQLTVNWNPDGPVSIHDLMGLGKKS
jgi:hypothetical protein